MTAETNPCRILLLSDTHGQLHPAIMCLAKDVQYIVHAGDVGHPGILDQLGACSAQLMVVRGNNDTPSKWPDGCAHVLSRLDDRADLALPGGELAVEHGHRANPVARRHAQLRSRHPQARLIVYGHSHRQLIDDADTPWVVNPGAAGRSRTYGGSGCIVLSAGVDRWDLQARQFPLAGWKT